MSALLDINGCYMRDMTESDRREIRMYGTTEDQMREAVEQSINTLANILEDQRQMLNRAKWILSEYVMTA